MNVWKLDIELNFAKNVFKFISCELHDNAMGI